MNRVFALRVNFFIKHLTKAPKSYKYEFFSKKELFQFSKKSLALQFGRHKSQISNAIINDKDSGNIFKRFKIAYKQHGKILIICHLISSWGWIVSFFFLAKA